MQYSTRHRVMKALQKALKQITPSNGYGYDLSEAVFLGRSEYGDGDPLPMVSILEPPVNNDKTLNIDNCSKNHHRFQAIVQGFAPDSPNPEDDTEEGYYLLAEVRRRIAQELRGAVDEIGNRNILGEGSSLVSMKMDPGVVRPADSLSNKNYFWMLVEFEIVEDVTDPYST